MPKIDNFRQNPTDVIGVVMKKFKKLATLLLSLTLGISFVACGDSSNKKNNKPKDEPTQSEIANEKLQDAVGEFVGNLLAPSAQSTGKKYIDGAIEAVQNAATIELDIDADVKYSFTDKQFGVQDTEDYGSDETTSLALDLEGTFKAVKTADGYDMGLEIAYDYSRKFIADEEPQETIDKLSIRAYLIDGYGYLYEPNYQAWVKTSMPFEQTYYYDMLSETLDSYLGKSSATVGNVGEDELTVIKNLIGKVFDGVCTVENNALKFDTDLKTPINEILTEYKNLDLKMTFKDYFNSVMKKEGLDITLEKILDDLATKGSLTLGEVYKSVDDWVKEATGKGVNDLKNALLAQEDIAFVLNKFQDFIDLSAIKALNIDNLIKPYEALTLDQIITLIMSSNEESVEPTMSILPAPDLSQTQVSPFAQLIESIKPIYNVTLEQMGVGEYVNLIKGITVDELKESMKISFNDFALSAFDFDLDADFVADLPMAKIDVDSTVAIDLSLSDTASVIKLPADATTIYYVFAPMGEENEYSLYFGVSEKEVGDNYVYDFTAPGEGTLTLRQGAYIVRYSFEYQIPTATTENSVSSVEITITEAKAGTGFIGENFSTFSENQQLTAFLQSNVGKKATINFNAKDGSVNLTAVPVPTEAELKEAAKTPVGTYYFFRIDVETGDGKSSYPIGSEYNNITLAKNSYVLTLNEDQTATFTVITQNGPMSSNGTWVKVDDTHVSITLNGNTQTIFCDCQTVEIAGSDEDNNSTLVLVKAD